MCARVGFPPEDGVAPVAMNGPVAGKLPAAGGLALAWIPFPVAAVVLAAGLRLSFGGGRRVTTRAGG